MTGSWGFLIRDHVGEVVMTGRGRVNSVLSAFHAELIACLQGDSEQFGNRSPHS